MKLPGRLLSIVLSGFLLPPGPLSGQSNRIQVSLDGQVSGMRAETTRLLIQIPYSFTYGTSRSVNPARISIDVRGTGGLSDDVRVIPVGTRQVKQVVIGAFKPGVTRVVVELTEESSQGVFTVTRLAQGRGLRIEIKRSTPAVPNPKPPAPVAADRPKSPAADRPTIRSVPPPAIVKPPEPKVDPAPPIPPMTEFHLPPRIGIVKEVPIALEQALHLALAGNPDIQASRIDREISGYKSTGAGGVYVPNLNWRSSFDNQTQPAGNLLSGSNSDSVLSRWWQTTQSVAGLSPRFGGSYEVAFSSEKYLTNNVYTTLNPSYPTALSVRYAQPLWRNLRYDSNRHAIAVAGKNQQMTREALRLRVTQIIRETEQAYWELASARRDLAVQLAALEIARAEEENIRSQLARGLAVAIEIVASETQVTNFEIAVSAAQEALTRSENSLKNLMLGDRSAELWDAGLEPTSAPATDFTTPALAETITEALAERAEFAQVRIAKDVNQAGQRLNREQLKPQVDLIASYSWAGLAGGQVVISGTNPVTDSLNPALNRLNQLSLLAGLGPVGPATSAPIPGVLSGGYGKSLGDLFGGNFPTTEIQLRVSLPFGNRIARANLEESMAEARRLGYQTKAVEQNIESEVRNALQAIDSARQRLRFSRARREAAEEQFRAEKRRFDSGDSTLFLVQQRQLTMVTSQIQVNRAEADLSQGISLLEFARGTNYKGHNIDLR